MNVLRIFIKYVFPLALVAGCSSTPELVAEVQPITQNVFKVIDGRSSDSKQTYAERVGSNLVCYVLGDDRVKPSVPTMIESYLFKTGNGRLANKTIEISKSDIRVYQLMGSNTSLAEKNTYTPPGTSPGAFVAGLLISDLLDVKFTEKRIEVVIEGMVDGKKVVASEYGHYTFGSPEKKTLEMLDNAMRKFADQI